MISVVTNSFFYLRCVSTVNISSYHQVIECESVYVILRVCVCVIILIIYDVVKTVNIKCRKKTFKTNCFAAVTNEALATTILTQLNKLLVSCYLQPAFRVDIMGINAPMCIGAHWCRSMSNGGLP